jgi:dienelactone hydrolase
MGYVAFAADIYGQEVRPVDMKGASELAGKYKSDRALMRERAQAALETLSSNRQVDKNKIAAIGFCFGGTVALELARDMAPLKGVVSFHGGLSSVNKATTMAPKILVLHGGDDPYVSPKEVAEFQQEMRDAKADWQFIAYGNTVHSFTQEAAGADNSKGAAYNEQSSKRAGREMETFFKDIF